MMVDLAPFPLPGTENAAQDATAKPKRRAGTRKPKTAKVPKAPKPKPVVELAPIPSKKPRKPRAAKTAKAKPAGKLGINEIVSATVGLKEDEAKTLLKIVGMLADHKKSAKPKILLALGKLFA